MSQIQTVDRDDYDPSWITGKALKIDFTSSSRSTLTIVGWNLDVARKNPDKYKVSISNNNEPERVVGRKFVSFQGQYAVTIDISSSGVPLEYNDKKLLFNGFDPLFEIAIVNTSPPPPPEKIVSVSGVVKTTNQDREGGFCSIELWDGGTLLWRHIWKEKPPWGDGHSEPFAFDNLKGPGDTPRLEVLNFPFPGLKRMVWDTTGNKDILVPENPRLLIILSQEWAEERNILWRFEAKAQFRTDRGNVIMFDQTGLELHCGDGRPPTVSTPVNLIR